MNDQAVRWLRFIVTAVIGTIAGVLLEHHVWKGRGA